jgi:C-methyltransferase C-terminal domain/Methyltransferase domain
MNSPATRASCPSCAGSELAAILHWPSIPVNAALFPQTRQDSLAVPRGSFRLVACAACGLLFNADHDEVLVEYSPRCVETQSCSPRHREFTDALAREWVERYDLRDTTVIEIGSGPDATFLRTMCELTGAPGIAVDPACTPGSDGVVTLLAERFTEAHAELPGGALVCRHTLEHVPEVASFLAATRTWAAQHPGSPVLFEVPDTGRILSHGAFWDLYYEHCSYFTRATLEGAFRRAGLEPERTRLEFDGQFLVLEAVVGSADPAAHPPADSVVEAAEAFARTITARIESAAHALRGLAGEGNLVLWQAGGKALAVLTLTGVDDAVAGLVDGNPAKRGLYLPGTAWSILGPQDVPALAPRHVVVMNTAYVDEIAATLAETGVTASVHPLEELFD